MINLTQTDIYNNPLIIKELLSDNINQSFFVVDKNWNFVYISKKLSKRKVDLLGKNLWVYFPNLLNSNFEYHYRQSLLHSSIIQFQEFYPLWKKYLTVQVIPYCEGLIICIEDLSTEHNMPFEFIQLRNNNIEDIIIIAKIHTAIEKPNISIIFANQKFYTISGYTHYNLFEQKISLLNGPIESSHIIHTIHNSIINLESLKTKLFIYDKLGNPQKIELEIFPIIDHNNNSSYCVIIAQLLRHDIDLPNSDALHSILNSSQIAYWEHDIINNISYFSNLYFNLLGYENFQPFWTIQNFYQHIHPEDQKRIFTEYQKILNGLTQYNTEFRCISITGEIRWLWTQGSIIFNHENNPIRINGIILDITERRKREEHIQHLAFYDSLTDLPNRRFLTNALEQALLKKQSYYSGLLFIDLDHFKLLNDSLGHDQGDLFLKNIGESITGCIRKTDIVARLGGDEFVVFLENLNNSYDEAKCEISFIGEKILKILNNSFDVGEYRHQSSGSIGATIFLNNTFTAEELLKQADIAMYKAKKLGRNNMAFF